MIGNLALKSFFAPAQLFFDGSENICVQLHKNNLIATVLIDLKKAFHIFDHEILF